MDLTFNPLIPLPFLALAAAAALAIGGLGLYRSLRGAPLRLFLGLALVLALANPVLRQEERAPLSTIVPVVVDRSQSQQLPEREAMTDATEAALKERLARLPGVEPRFIEAKGDPDADSASTRLFSALTDAMSDVPPSRVGGAILVTDGQVHDVPASGKPGLDAPVSSLITGKANEIDRRIEIVSSPRFGLKGKEIEVLFRIRDDGVASPSPAEVTVRVNGEETATLTAVPGEPTPFRFTVGRAGTNVVELSAAVLPGEISETNNRAVQLVDGIRENMRVLLVSGEPHAGERTWRNLLKSDAAVDLVHFTILRPPQKQDGTPINELSLIAFPTQELFVDKINQFDLIIFDRYQHRGVLPLLYYDNIVQYVQQGGALLIAAGPEHAGQDSIALTPLEAVLPAAPDGDVVQKGFYPRISEEGRKHPVTRGLEGGASEPPSWGRWFRTIGVSGAPQGHVIMEGADKKPLLVLNRSGEGRVAMLLSDQGWLWARNFEGGGPHAALYRRIAHWLMKDPDLEEEALTATASGRTITVTRQTLSSEPGPATLRTPSGKDVNLDLKQAEPGLFRAELAADETGLFEVKNGAFSTLVHVGAANSPEFKAMVSTEALLRPVAEATGGIVARLAGGSGIVLPDILPVSGNARVEPDGRILLRMTGETVLKGVSTWPLLGGLFGVIVLLAAITATWWREGR